MGRVFAQREQVEKEKRAVRDAPDNRSGVADVKVGRGKGAVAPVDPNFRPGAAGREVRTAKSIVEAETALLGYTPEEAQQRALELTNGDLDKLDKLPYAQFPPPRGSLRVSKETRKIGKDGRPERKSFDLSLPQLVSQVQRSMLERGVELTQAQGVSLPENLQRTAAAFSEVIASLQEQGYKVDPRALNDDLIVSVSKRPDGSKAVVTLGDLKPSLPDFALMEKRPEITPESRAENGPRGALPPTFAEDRSDASGVIETKPELDFRSGAPLQDARFGVPQLEGNQELQGFDKALAGNEQRTHVNLSTPQLQEQIATLEKRGVKIPDRDPNGGAAPFLDEDQRMLALLQQELAGRDPNLPIRSEGGVGKLPEGEYDTPKNRENAWSGEGPVQRVPQGEKARATSPRIDPRRAKPDPRRAKPEERAQNRDAGVESRKAAAPEKEAHMERQAQIEKDAEEKYEREKRQARSESAGETPRTSPFTIKSPTPPPGAKPSAPAVPVVRIEGKPLLGKSRFSKGPEDERTLRRAVADILSKNDEAPTVAKLQAVTDELAALLGLDSEITVTNDRPPGHTGAWFGYMSFDEKTGKATIHVNPRLKSTQALSTLSHEIGHLVYFEKWDSATQAQREAITDDFLKWMENTKGMTAGEARASRATIDLGELLKHDRRSLDELSAEQTMYLLHMEEYFADHVARALQTNRKAQGVVGKFFSQVAETLRSLYRLLKDGLPDKSVKEFVDSLIATAEARKRAQTAHTVASANPGVPPPQGVQQEQANATLAGTVNPFSPAANASLREMFRGLSRAHRAVLKRLFNEPGVVADLRKLLKGDTAALAEIDDPALGNEARIAHGYALWQAELLNIDEAQEPFEKLKNDYARIFGLLTNTDYAKRLLIDMMAGKTNQSYSVYAELAKSAPGRLYGKLIEKYNNTWLPAIERVVTTGIDEQLRGRDIPALTRLAMRMKPQTGDRTNDIGVFQARVVNAGHFHTKMGRAIAALNHDQLAEARDVLQGVKKPGLVSTEAREAAAKLRELFDDLYDYTQGAGVEFEKKNSFYPIVMLPAEELVKRKGEFYKLFGQPHFIGRMRTKLAKLSKTKESKARVLSMKPVELVDVFWGMALGDGDSAALPEWSQGSQPSFREMNEQVMDFMRGNAATPEDRIAFGKLQEQNLAYVVARYVEHAVKRSEYTRRFKDQSLEQVLLEAQQQGAKKEDLEFATKYVDAMMGSFGLSLATPWQYMFNAVDAVRGKPYGPALTPEKRMLQAKERAAKVRQWSGYLSVYQNVRTLALATLSSLVDPLGVGIRSGNAFEAFRAMRDSFRALGKNSMPELKQLAEDFGLVETAVSNEALAMAYGGLHLTRGARAVSDTFFKAIGLTQWTRATRVAAFASAQRFLLRHADGISPTSKRYMQELGLEPGDVQDDGNGYVKLRDIDPGAETRVRNALARWVDEAILRPNASQRPLWMSDPNYMLFSQYKAFMYAFNETILKRVKHELREGNVNPLLVAMMYAPVMLVAELLREALQHGPEGDPRREEWGPLEYMGHATKRAGLLGPREYVADAVNDVNYGSIPGASFLGPTVAQSRDFYGDKPWSRVAVEALPGSGLYEDW